MALGFHTKGGAEGRHSFRGAENTADIGCQTKTVQNPTNQVPFGMLRCSSKEIQVGLAQLQ